MEQLTVEVPNIAKLYPQNLSGSNAWIRSGTGEAEQASLLRLTTNHQSYIPRGILTVDCFISEPQPERLGSQALSAHDVASEYSSFPTFYMCMFIYSAIMYEQNSRGYHYAAWYFSTKRGRQSKHKYI